MVLNKNHSITELKVDGGTITGDHCVPEHFNEIISNIETSTTSGFTKDESYAQPILSLLNLICISSQSGEVGLKSRVFTSSAFKTKTEKLNIQVCIFLSCKYCTATMGHTSLHILYNITLIPLYLTFRSRNFIFHCVTGAFYGSTDVLGVVMIKEADFPMV